MAIPEHITGSNLYELAADLYPICRSITGDGFRQSLAVLQRFIPLEVRSVPSGTPVFDWTVPKEWNIRDAYVKNAQGQRVIDFRASNLHIVSYSTPVHATMPLAELRPHLHTLPEHPDWIPYRTSYYAESWGFCLTHNALQALPDGEYEVCIDTTLAPGRLCYGELLLPGQTDEEVLVSTHCCHPSLANDNLSGMAVATFLAASLLEQSRRAALRYTYRFLFLPGTIGAITWLACNEEHAHTIKHGLVAACVGDPGMLTYKASRQGDAEIDRAVLHVLKSSGAPYRVEAFSPYGYDERQYSSPGFNLPVGCLSRTPYSQYPEYHTSADNLSFIRPEALEDSLKTYGAVIDVLENNRVYINRSPKCEPQLGKRGLYDSYGGKQALAEYRMALLWVLNQSDGSKSLLDIAERSGIAFAIINDAAKALAQTDLLAERI